MREELLAHLMSVFEEELGRTGDNRTALREVKGRFGDVRELSTDLQRSVPSWDRCRALVDQINLQPGESFLHLAGKQLMVTLGLCATLFLATVPFMIIRGRQDELRMTLHVLLVVELGAVALSLLLSLLPHTLGRALFGKPSERSLRMTLLYGVASLPVFPAFAFLVNWGASFDISASLVHARFACYFAVAAPFLFAIMSKQMVEDKRYQDEWASLEIEE